MPPGRNQSPSFTWAAFLDNSSMKAKNPHIPQWLVSPCSGSESPSSGFISIQHSSHCFPCLSPQWAMTSTRLMTVFPSLCAQGPRTSLSIQWAINLCRGIKWCARARKDLRKNPGHIWEMEAQTGEGTSPNTHRKLLVFRRWTRERNQRCQQCLRRN